MKSHSKSDLNYIKKFQEYLTQSYKDYLDFQNEQMKYLKYIPNKKIDEYEQLYEQDSVEYQLFINQQSNLIDKLISNQKDKNKDNQVFHTHRYEVCCTSVSEEIANIKRCQLDKNINRDENIILAGFKNSLTIKLMEGFENDGYKIQFYNLIEQNNLDKIYEGTISNVLFLLQDSADDFYKIMETVFMHVKYLCAYASNKLMHSNISVMAIDLADGMFGFNEKDSSNMKGCVSGLIKTVNKEYSSYLSAKYININKELDERDIFSIVKDELIYAIPYIEIAYMNREVAYIPYLQKKEVEKNNQYKNCFSSKDVFLVSGGAKGITAMCVKKISQQYGCKFIILGRTRIDEDKYPELTEEKELESMLIRRIKSHQLNYTPAQLKREIRQSMDIKDARRTMAELREMGSEAVYISCDITKADEVKKYVENAEKCLGTITGILHGAGVISDKYMHQKEVTDFKKVFGTKYWGFINMMSSVNISNLKIMILFSSVAAYFGNRGQGDYAMANEYLNYISKYYKNINKKCKTVSINWGPWDGGMVVKSVKELMERSGIHLIKRNEGIYHFMNEFCLDDKYMPQIVINSSNKF